jgi:hypothetical protein
MGTIVIKPNFDEASFISATALPHFPYLNAPVGSPPPSQNCVGINC